MGHQHPGFAVGMSGIEIGDKVKTLMAKYNDAIIITFDNSNHDSH